MDDRIRHALDGVGDQPGIILSVCVATKSITLHDGQVIPITNWLCGREEISGPEGATTAVAGPCADGQWYATVLMDEDFD